MKVKNILNQLLIFLKKNYKDIFKLCTGLFFIFIFTIYIDLFLEDDQEKFLKINKITINEIDNIEIFEHIEYPSDNRITKNLYKIIYNKMIINEFLMCLKKTSPTILNHPLFHISFDVKINLKNGNNYIFDFNISDEYNIYIYIRGFGTRYENKCLYAWVLRNKIYSVQ